jgi:hypothetical protein
MVRAIPPMSPIQFSTLKGLNPLHDEPEHAEDDESQGDIEQVFHGALLGEEPVSEPRYWPSRTAP